LHQRATTTRSTATARKSAGCSPRSKSVSASCRFSAVRAVRSPTSRTFPWARAVGTFLGKAAEADHPKLMAWVATINNHPAVTRALATVDEVRAKTTAFDKTDEGARDRLFDRGRYTA
jgi:hypothetical protein